MVDSTEIIALSPDVMVILLGLFVIAITTYAGLKDHRFMMLSGIAWVFISLSSFQAYDDNIGLLGAFTGIILGLWGAYKIALS